MNLLLHQQTERLNPSRRLQRLSTIKLDYRQRLFQLPSNLELMSEFDLLLYLEHLIPLQQ
ncbi:MAG: hypothetical protein EBS48_08425 [Actinobacteria bacterium]|nr:hypothetical protein [Actinomycetota bacterium]